MIGSYEYKRKQEIFSIMQWLLYLFFLTTNAANKMKSLEWICNTFSYQSGTCLAFTLHQLNDLVFRMMAVDLELKSMEEYQSVCE